MFSVFVFALFIWSTYAIDVVFSDHHCDTELDDDFSPILFELGNLEGFSKETKENEVCRIDSDELVTFSGRFFNSTVEDMGVKFDDGCDFLEKVFHEEFGEGCLPSGWEITGVLGNGKAGRVYSTIGPKGKTGALKIQHEDGFIDTKSEVMMNKLFHHVGLTGEFKEGCVFEQDGELLIVTHSEKIDMTLNKYLYLSGGSNFNILCQKIFELFERMRKNGLTHGDFHLHNIGIIVEDDGKTGILQVMDFGLSRFGSDPVLDIMSLIASLFRTGKEPLSVIFRDEVFKTYGYKFPNDNDEFEVFRNSYRKYPLYSEYFERSRELGFRMCYEYGQDNDESFDCSV